MIILKLYFLIGFIYLLLSTIFGDIEHSITIHIRRLIVFILIWPLLLYSIFLKYGKVLKFMKLKTIWKIFMLGTDKEYERKKLKEEIALYNENNKDGLQAKLWDDDDEDVDSSEEINSKNFN